MVFLKRSLSNLGVKITGCSQDGVGRQCAHPSHRCTKIIIIYRATIDENDLKSSRKDFPQLKV